MTDGRVTYDDLLAMLDAGMPGRIIEAHLRELGGGDGNYTVYWPHDSIRVIDGASYGIARAVALLLRDPRTRWMSEPTTFAAPIIAPVRREVNESDQFATPGQISSGRTYVRDRFLPWDIRVVDVDDPGFLLAGRESTPDPWFDFSTLPEN